MCVVHCICNDAHCLELLQCQTVHTVCFILRTSSHHTSPLWSTERRSPSTHTHAQSQHTCAHFMCTLQKPFELQLFCPSRMPHCVRHQTLWSTNHHYPLRELNHTVCVRLPCTTIASCWLLMVSCSQRLIGGR